MKRAIVLDANLTTILCIGPTGNGKTVRHKSPKGYSDTDFAILSEAMESAVEYLTVPNILTEASNLTRHVRDPLNSEVLAAMKAVSSGSRETNAPSTRATKMPQFEWLGLADCAILAPLDEQAALLTAHQEPFAVVARSGRHAVLFDSLR